MSWPSRTPVRTFSRRCSIFRQERGSIHAALNAPAPADAALLSSMAALRASAAPAVDACSTTAPPCVARPAIRRIVQPIRGITDTMRRLAEGDMSVAIGGQHRRDEIGGMATALVVFRDGMVASCMSPSHWTTRRKKRSPRSGALNWAPRRRPSRRANQLKPRSDRYDTQLHGSWC